MRIAILHNFVPPDAPPEDQDTLVQVEAISAALVRLGHEPVAVPCELDLGAMRGELLRLRPEVIFSLVESLDGADSLVYLPAAVMDMLGIRYCGCRTEALFLTTHKTLAKERMCKFGLPTPEWMEGRPIIHEGDEGDEGIHEGHEGYEDTDCVKGGSGDREKPSTGNAGGEFRQKQGGFSLPPLASCFPCSSWILKGVWDQGSRGLDDEAVLCNVEPGEVRRRLAERASRWGRPCFAERFIEGREFNLGLLAGPDGPESLPPAEIDFSAFPPEKPRIVGYRAKWEDDSFESRNTQRRFDFPACDAALLERLGQLARRCWAVFRLRGWARVDFRVDAAGQPWILEINGNPCLSPDAGFAAAMQRASISYDQGIQRILEDAIR